MTTRDSLIESTVDVLDTARLLSQRGLPPTRGEIHLFVFFACVLGEAIAPDDPIPRYEDFAATPTGEPFSVSLETAIAELTSAGYLQERDETLSPTPLGLAYLAAVPDLLSSVRRRPLLAAVVESLLVVPVGLLRHAVTSTTEMMTARQLRSLRPLFAGVPAPSAVGELRQVAAAIPDAGDLFVLASAWLHARLALLEHVET